VIPFPTSGNADQFLEFVERHGELAEALASSRKSVALAEAQQLLNVEGFRSRLSRLEVVGRWEATEVAEEADQKRRNGGTENAR
jgi:hypothetical protein